MQKLVELANHLNNYNLKGTSHLSPIKLAVLYKRTQMGIVQGIVKELQCEKTNASFELLGLSGYEIMRSGVVLGLELHLLCSLMDEEAIADEMFLRRKKIIERLRCRKETIFLYLEEEEAKNVHDKSEIFELKRADMSACKNVLWKGNSHLLYGDLLRAWESIHRYDLIGVLANLKQLMKNLERDRKRQQEWITVKQREGDQLAFAFQLLSTCNQYLVCSLQGFYSREACHFQHQYSVHWQIMDIFQDLWKEEGQKLTRELQRMPLSYIGQRLKMSNCHSLGGFLPQSCFLQVFRPMLLEMAEHVICCLEGSKYKVLQNIQVIYQYYFTKTSIREALVQLQLKNVQQICQGFLKQVQNAIYSQINYVYTPAESFWEMRSIRSNLYSQQQQANIEVKYIGKIYVKKVYESIRESIPRYIGQGLLRKVSRYFRENGLNNLLDVVRETQFKVTLSKQEVEEIQEKEKRLQEFGKLFQYFSLKVSSTYKIKDLGEKTERRWKQMYQRKIKEQEAVHEQDREQKGGLVRWIKRLFTSDKRQPKRSSSSDKQSSKQEQSQTIKEDKQKESNKQTQQAISQKQWILIINTNRKIDEQRLHLSACEGFPERLRPAIWVWFARRNSQQRQPRVIQLLQKHKVQEETVRQIQKDLGRTPPPELFKIKYRVCMRRVLSAYSTTDQEIRYTQGMNFIAAIAIATIIHWGVKDDYLTQSAEKQNPAEIEQKSFILLRHIMMRQGFRRVMLIEREYMAELCFRIDEKIKELSQRVWKVIQESGFTCQIIFGPVLLSGLATWSKHMTVSRRIMDLFISHGFGILWRVVAGVAAMGEEQVTKLRNQQVYDFLRNKALDDFYERAGEQGLTKLFLSV